MMLAQILNFVVGRDQRGRWTAMAAGGRAGGFFVSRDAALRYARLETARTPGAVRQASSPERLGLSQDRLGSRGEGLPDGWRHAPAAEASAFSRDGLKGAISESRAWLLLDIGIAIGFVLLCLATGMMLS